MSKLARTSKDANRTFFISPSYADRLHQSNSKSRFNYQNSHGNVFAAAKWLTQKQINCLLIPRTD
jgi:hypothetical protein